MKLAISNIAWLPAENREIARILRQESVCGLEVAPTLLFKQPEKAQRKVVAEVRRFWNDHGIDIVAMQSLLFNRADLQLFGDREQRAVMLDYLQRIVELAGLLGAEILVFGSPKNRTRGDLPYPKALDIAADFFTHLANTAADHNTCFCIEPNAGEYGCDFVTNLAEGADLVRRVGRPGFGLHVDAGVMTLNGEGEDALDAVYPCIRHFHISEPFLGTVTAGRTNHRCLGRLLRSRGYTGWVSIEMRHSQGPANPTVVQECLRYAIEHYA